MINNKSELDYYYNKIIKGVASIPKDEIVEVNQKFIDEIGIGQKDRLSTEKDRIQRRFHVVETNDRITLWNQYYVIWIIPNQMEEELKTIVLIADNRPKEPKLLNILFIKGIYNNSTFILQLIDQMLAELQENDQFIVDIEEDDL